MQFARFSLSPYPTPTSPSRRPADPDQVTHAGSSSLRLVIVVGCLVVSVARPTVLDTPLLLWAVYHITFWAWHVDTCEEGFRCASARQMDATPPAPSVAVAVPPCLDPSRVCLWLEILNLNNNCLPGR